MVKILGRCGRTLEYTHVDVPPVLLHQALELSRLYLVICDLSSPWARAWHKLRI